MESRIGRALVLMMSVTVLLLASVIESYSDSARATIEYIYDEVGNVIEKTVSYSTATGADDTSPPVTTASPGGGFFNTGPVSVSLQLSHIVSQEMNLPDGVGVRGEEDQEYEEQSATFHTTAPLCVACQLAPASQLP